MSNAMPEEYHKTCSVHQYWPPKNVGVIVKVESLVSQILFAQTRVPLPYNGSYPDLEVAMWVPPNFPSATRKGKEGQKARLERQGVFSYCEHEL